MKKYRFSNNNNKNNINLLLMNKYQFSNNYKMCKMQMIKVN